MSVVAPRLMKSAQPQNENCPLISQARGMKQSSLRSDLPLIHIRTSPIWISISCLAMRLRRYTQLLIGHLPTDSRGSRCFHHSSVRLPPKHAPAYPSCRDFPSYRLKPLVDLTHTCSRYRGRLESSRSLSSTLLPFRVLARGFPSYFHTLPKSPASNDRLENVSGDPFPFLYPDPDLLGFGRCKNPTQLEKSVASYLKSHPQPTERAIVAMLAACENLTKIAVLPSGQRHSSRGLPPTSAQAGTSDLRSTLLQTILSSSTFTSDDVFRIARYIFHDIATRSYIETSRGEDTSTELVHAPLQVTNAFLHVCAVTGHFDEASAVLEDMMGRAQGDVKPDLTTYRNVLRAAHVHRQQLQKQGVDTGDLDIKVDNIIDRAAEALAKQTRMALRIKLGLGALIGATVGKFTMMGILALPPLRFMGEVEEPKLEEHSTAMETSLPVDGIIHYMESHELAMGVGLAVGILTAGYFIRGSTRHSRIVSEQDPTPKSRSKDSRSSIGYRNALQDLPRAKLLGLYFPDLPTTNLDEIRENLRSNMKV